MLLRGLRAVVLPNGRLLTVAVPDVLAALLPTEKAGFMLPLIRRAAEDERVLFPDAAPGEVEPRVGESSAERQTLGVRVEHIDGSVALHVLLHINESGEQELIKVRVRHVVVLDLTRRLLNVHVV